MRTWIAIALFLAAALSVRASTLTWQSSSRTAAVGDSVKVTLTLNTEGEDVNAIEGSVRLPAAVTLEAIGSGNSVVSVWIESPRYSTSSGAVTFSGIMPAGYRGDRGKLFDLTFTSGAASVSSIEITSARVLKNDGKGTETPLTVTPFMLAFAHGIPTSSIAETPDRIPPEEFVPTIAHDPSIFGGAYFLVFATTDKGVGIERYEVMEVNASLKDSLLNRWNVGESPYLLDDQSLHSDIYVRAVDTEGNFRIVKLAAQNLLSGGAWWRSWYAIPILIMLILIAGYLRGRMRRRLAA